MDTNQTVVFDTLEGVRRLKEAGHSEKQAESVIRVLADSQARLVTKEYFDLKVEIIDEQFRTLELRVIFKVCGIVFIMLTVATSYLSYLITHIQLIH